MKLTITGDQALALMGAIEDNTTGDDIDIVQFPDNSLLVLFSLASVSIAPDGEAEEN